jgi:hypothetical protein
VEAVEGADSISTPVRVVAALGHWFGVEDGSISDVRLAEGLH